jgi:pilus assembly protein TadC
LSIDELELILLNQKIRVFLMKKEIKKAKKIKNLIENSSNNSYIENFLKKNFRKKDIERIKNRNLKISIFLGLLSFLTAELYIINLQKSSLIGIITFIFSFLLLMILPITAHKRKVKRVEANLPFFLIKLITEIKIGNNFFNALKKLTKKSGAVENEFKKIIIHMESGKSFEEACIELNKSLMSIEVKRALSSLSNIYSHGGDEKSIKRLAEELFLKQRIESKEFSGKMVVYSLVFIAISAIVPAMFSSFILIGSYFLAIEFTPFQILLIITIIFPVLDLSLLYIINSKTPLFLKN